MLGVLLGVAFTVLLALVILLITRLEGWFRELFTRTAPGRALGLVFDSHGRASRRGFAAVALPLIGCELTIVGLAVRAQGHDALRSSWIAPIMLAIFVLPGLALPVSIRRMHDLGHSAFWIYLFGLGLRFATLPLALAKLHGPEHFALAAGFAGGLGYLALAPGQVAPNKYGPPPQVVTTA